jgi:hypothetical protein
MPKPITDEGTDSKHWKAIEAQKQRDNERLDKYACIALAAFLAIPSKPGDPKPDMTAFAFMSFQMAIAMKAEFDKVTTAGQ